MHVTPLTSCSRAFGVVALCSRARPCLRIGQTSPPKRVSSRNRVSHRFRLNRGSCLSRGDPLYDAKKEAETKDAAHTHTDPCVRARVYTRAMRVSTSGLPRDPERKWTQHSPGSPKLPPDAGFLPPREPPNPSISFHTCPDVLLQSSRIFLDLSFFYRKTCWERALLKPRVRALQTTQTNQAVEERTTTGAFLLISSHLVLSPRPTLAPGGRRSSCSR